MLITKKCPFTGEVNQKEIPVTPLQLERWEKGELIQKAMPNLTDSQREFIMTGITDDVWNETFGEI